MMAILEDALRCFQNNAGAASGRRKRLFLEAEEWLCGTGGEGPFSFNMVCGALGIEPEFLRNELLDGVLSSKAVSSAVRWRGDPQLSGLAGLVLPPFAGAAGSLIRPKLLKII